MLIGVGMRWGWYTVLFSLVGGDEGTVGLGGWMMGGCGLGRGRGGLDECVELDEWEGRGGGK